MEFLKMMFFLKFSHIICTKWSMKLDESYTFNTVTACCTIIVYYIESISIISSYPLTPSGLGLWAAPTMIGSLYFAQYLAGYLTNLPNY